MIGGVITHYTDVIMSVMASQITSLTIVYSTVYSGADQRKYHSSASLAFVRGIHRSPVNSPRKGPVTRKRYPFDDVIMSSNIHAYCMQSMCMEPARMYRFIYHPSKKVSYSTMRPYYNMERRNMIL